MEACEFVIGGNRNLSRKCLRNSQRRRRSCARRLALFRSVIAEICFEAAVRQTRIHFAISCAVPDDELQLVSLPFVTNVNVLKQIKDLDAVHGNNHVSLFQIGLFQQIIVFVNQHSESGGAEKSDTDTFFIPFGKILFKRLSSSGSNRRSFVFCR